MAWIILVTSAIFEAIWATALGRAEGLTQPVPTIIFALALTISMLGLGWAAKRIPMGTAYAVWVGIGAALTVTYAIVVGEEPFSPLRVVFIAGIVGAVVGLKLVPAPAPEEPPHTS
ncbi:DMT family transporter [Rhodococcus sp. JT-3]|uniref:DMT family transporter n=1 Tax=Rhodococcus sp. JT-3 TaxID=1973213 RepID=UPI001303C54B|nr:multidrug efflux SMR transporter [Rhodococcus sp. JT-3]